MPSLETYYKRMTDVPSVRRSTNVGWDTWSDLENKGPNLWSKALHFVAEFVANRKELKDQAQRLLELACGPHPSSSADGNTHVGAFVNSEVTISTVAVSLEETDTNTTCTSCGQKFPSRTKLMKHVHAAGPHGTGKVPGRPELLDFKYIKSHKFGKTRPLASLGSGDSVLLLDVIPVEIAASMLEMVRDEVKC